MTNFIQTLRIQQIIPYIDAMDTESKGPIAAEMEKRLVAALAPTQLNIINDSAMHSGHAGDNGTGESHFTVEISCAAFAGQSRVSMQRMVNKALGDLLEERVHALAIKASPPERSA